MNYQRGCGHCITCTHIGYIDEYIMWPGGVDTDLYFMFKRNQMKYLFLQDTKWVAKKQPVNELAERRGIKLSVNVPAVLGTGLAEDTCEFVRVIHKGHLLARRCHEMIVDKPTLDEYFVNLVVM